MYTLNYMTVAVAQLIYHFCKIIYYKQQKNLMSLTNILKCINKFSPHCSKNLLNREKAKSRKVCSAPEVGILVSPILGENSILLLAWLHLGVTVTHHVVKVSNTSVKEQFNKIWVIGFYLERGYLSIAATRSLEQMPNETHNFAHDLHQLPRH